MKLRTTVFLLLLTASLTAFVFLYERRQPPRELAGFLLFDLEGDVLRDETVALEITPDDVGGIDLKSAAGDIAIRRSEGGTWEMTRGIKDRAGRDQIKVLLDFISKARILDRIDESEIKSGRVKESALGLDESGAVEITYRRPGGNRLVTLKLGRTAPLGQAMYAKFSGVESRPDVYIVSPDLREFLTQPPDRFRDLAISKYPAERIRKFSIKQGEGEIEISRESTSGLEKSPWVISRPLQNARADQEVVDDFLSMVTSAKLSAFSAGTGTGAAVPATQLLAEVTLWPDGAYDRKGISLAFYPDPDASSKEAICRDRERRIEFKVDRELVDSIAQAKSPNTFRDQKLGNIDPAKVVTLNVDVNGGDNVGLYRVGDQWAVRREGTEEFQVASGDAVGKLIKAINEAEILDFTRDSLVNKAEFGLDQPAVVLTFATGQHSSLARLAPLTTENSRILRFGVMPTGKVYANFADEPFIYQVGPEVPGLVPRQLIRWRTLQLPGFERINLRLLRQTLGGAPPVELKSAANSFVWSAQRAGEDVTGLLDQQVAENIAARLGSLQVTSWQADSDASLRALAGAPIVVEAAYETAGQSGDSGRVQQIRVEFAPMSPSVKAPLYYGRHSMVPGVFLINAQTAQDFAGALLKTDL